MVVGFYRSKCIIAFVGAVYMCSLLEGVISSSVNKAPIVPSGVWYVQTKPINPRLLNKTDQLNYRRHRRKLPNESSDQQFNSLDDNGLQFQEYQGVFGRPGVDFPVLSHIPITKFNCRDVKNSNTGYYADLDTHCQVFHVCDSGRKVSFLCPNGTIFRQSHLICDWWFRVECERSPELYEQSVHMLEADQHLYKQRAAAITNAMHNLLAKGMKESTMVESPVSVTNVFNSESDLPKSTPTREARPTHLPAYNLPPQNVFSNVGNNKLQNGNNFGPNFGVTLPIPNQSTFEYPFVPVTPSPGVAKNTEPSGRNIANFNHPANANLIQTNQKAQTNTPSVFNTMSFDLKQNSIAFTQPTSSNVVMPSRPMNLINSTPSPLRTPTSNSWTPLTGYNSISPPSQNTFNADQKTNNLAKYNPTFHLKSPPINVPNFTPGRYPITEQNYPTTRFRATSPRSTVPPTLTTQINYNFEFTTLKPPQSDFTKSYFTMTNSQLPVTTLLKTKLPSQTKNYSPTPLSTVATTFDNNYFREQQIPEETASFAGNGKYPKWQDYYLNQNYNSQTKLNSKPVSVSSTPSTPPVETTLFSDVPTTDSIYNMLFDSQFANHSNQSYALYFPSDENVIDLLNLVTPEPDEGITDLVRNFSRPAVSELLLNSFATSMNIRETTPAQPVQEAFPILLRNETKEAYEQLFSNKEREVASDLLIGNSNGIVQSSSPKTLPTSDTLNEKLKLKSTPDFRELAQIFSRALSAYLENPEQFRKILSEVRPTEPPSLETSARQEAAEEEVLAFSEDERTTQRPVTLSSTSKNTLRSPETFAEEINNFMFDPFGFHADSTDFNVNETYYPSTEVSSAITTFTISPPATRTKAPTSFPTFSTTAPSYPPSPPTKSDLYNDKNNKFVDNSVQNIQDEPVLITADTQSFVASDNLVRYPLYGKYASSKYTLSPPNLKSPAYPQFGVRTSSASFTATPYISSRADVGTTPRTTLKAASSVVTAYEPAQTTFEEESLRTTMNIVSPNTLKPVFNESAVNSMVDMMELAKTNAALRNKLVLLLVNNGQAPENRSVKDLKSKLLKALLVPLSTKVYDNGFTEQPISRRKVRKEGRVPTARLMVASTTPLYRTPTDFTSKSMSRMTTRTSRTGRATAMPAKQIESDGLTDTDSRAVDLLKTLYSLASNNWNR